MNVAHDLTLEHGRCVVVSLPTLESDLRHWAADTLPSEELVFAETLQSARRRTWLGGRIALRAALSREGLETPAVLSDERGAPRLPAGVRASISHKTDVAAAIVARETAATIGLDIEVDTPPTHDISRRVLTDEERAEQRALDASARPRDLLVRFSAKEALYKALDPFVRRYVGFREARVTPAPDGTARVVLGLRAGEGPFEAAVRWMIVDSLILSTARLLPTSP